VNHCFICHHKIEKHSQYKCICSGCLNLMVLPQHDCQQCGVELQSANAICGSCQKSPPLFSHVDYACIYQTPIDVWIKALKFGNNILMSRLIADVLHKNLSQFQADYCFMPVPLHQSRLRSRGFNQAYEIAKELVKYDKRPIDNSLKRVVNTQMQAQLKLNQRAKNVRKAFKIKGELTHKNIILIDDVMTSGNTIRECAKTLVQAGADDVRVLVFARKSLNN